MRNDHLDGKLVATFGMRFDKDVFQALISGVSISVISCICSGKKL